MKSIIKSALLASVGMALATSSAMGAFIFTNGDLILGFQATGGTGVTKNVFYNLGAGTTYRDNPALGSLGNISTTLSATYGANWYTRQDVWFGVIGNLNQHPTSGIGSRAAVDGDPSRTFYLSAPTSTVGGGALYAANAYAPATLGSGGNFLSGLEAILPGLTTEGDNAAILNQTTQPVQWANGWTRWNPTPGAAFDVFTGGIQQNLGKGTPTTLVDLQRVLATNTGASPAGVVGGGTYETTFAIGSDGSLQAVPEASTSMLVLAAGTLLISRRRRA